MYFCSYKCCFTLTFHFFLSLLVIWCAFSSATYSSYVALSLMRLFLLLFAAVSTLHECMSLRSNIFCFITVASFYISFTRFFLRRWHVLVCLCVCMRLWQKVHMFVSIKVHKRRHFFGCQWSRGKTFLDVIDMHSIFMLFKHQSDPLRRSVSIRHLYLKKQPL